MQQHLDAVYRQIDSLKADPAGTDSPESHGDA
jgi:hypothetical protein